MSSECITYRREDILKYKSYIKPGYTVINHTLLKELSNKHTNNGLLYKRTKRGCRAGRKRTKTIKRIPQHLGHFKPVSAQKLHTNQAYLPKLFYTNCRSLNQWKLEELKVLADINKPNVICLTETWLDVNKQSTAHIDGYVNHFAHRKGRIGGGVAVMVSSKITSKTVATHSTKTISAVWTKITVGKYKPVIISCIYHPPGANDSLTQDYITSTLLKLSKSHSNAKFLITGDFNRLDLTNIKQQFGLRNIVNFNTRQDALLDLILTDIPDYKDPVQLAPLANNDHCCIILDGQPVKSTKYTKIMRRKFTPQRKNLILADIARENWDSVVTASTVHEKVNALHKTVNSILDKHCPLQPVKMRADKPPWMTEAIQKLIRARETAHKRKCKSYKVIRALVQRRIRASKRSFVNETLNKNTDTKTWWNTVKKLTNQAKDNSMPDSMIIDGTKLSPSEFSKQINDFYINIGGTALPSTVNITPDSERELQPISIGEAKILLKKLDTSKATSKEDFPAWVSKSGCEDMCIPVHNILNCMLSSCEYPDMWKRAQVKPAPKTQSPSSFKEYRPISLLFHLGKVAEQVIINKMRSRVDEIVNQQQYAYQPLVSTTDALLQLTDDWTSILDQQTSVKFIQNACLDFSKAFDRLDHSTLISKMLNYDFNRNVIMLVKSFLTDRVQCVKHNSSFSDYCPAFVGTPQGTKLGPILWLIYSNDFNIDNFSKVQYADDTTIYKPVKTFSDNVSDGIKQAVEWSKCNNMLLNNDKTVILNVAFSEKDGMSNPINFDNTDIVPSDSAKFLGVTVDKTLTFSQHVSSVLSKCNSRIFLMKQLKQMGMNSNGLLTFYKTNLKPVLSYACPAWYTFLADKDKAELERLQKTATKIIFTDTELYEERLSLLNLTPVNDFLFSTAEKYFSKISENSSHPLFSRIRFNTFKTSSRKPVKYRTEICRTEKRKKSFFQFFMRHFN